MTDTDTYPFWEQLEEKFQYFAPVFLILLVLYMYNSFVSTVLPKPWKSIVFYTIIGYFVLELIVKYLACRDPKYFLYNYWIDILLVIPIFKSLKIFGMVGKSLKFLKFLPYTRKALKLPKLIKRSKSLLVSLKNKIKKLVD